MNAYLLPGLLGLLTGILLYWTGLCQPEGLCRALSLRRSTELRSGLSALGYAIAGTALLGWLAVLDVDTIQVLPLTPGALLGGALLGVCCGLCGFTPSTAFAGAGGGSPAAAVVPEALCVLAGCGGMAWLLPVLSGPMAALQSPVWADGTLFRVTLDENYLLDGGFLALGCGGLLIAVIGLCIPNPKPKQAEEAAPLPPEEPAPAAAPPPEEATADVVIALQEGEEPLVIDTGVPLPEETEEDAPDGE